MAGAMAEEDLQVEIQEQQIFEAQATEETKHGLFWGHHYNIRSGRILNSCIHRVRVRKQLNTAFLLAK